MPTVNLDTSARLDIICRRGDTFDLTVDFNTTLTTAYPATAWKLQVRDSDTIINDGSSGMDVDGGLYVYDLQTDASGTRTWLHGEFKIIEDITT